MSNKLAFTGLAILITGMVLSISIAHVVNSQESLTSASFTERTVGEFVSNTIDMSNSSGILYLSNNSSVVFLVPSDDLGSVNSSSAVNYAVQPSATGNVTDGQLLYSLGDTGRIYSNLTGPFNIVVFAPTTPSVSYDRAPAVDNSLLSLYGPLTVLGEAMWIAGTIVTAIGFVYVRKKKSGGDAGPKS